MWLLGTGIFVGLFALGAVLGAPYLPTRKKQIKAALKLLNLKPGDTVIDLGSGDASFLIAAARQGINGIGYEINPVLVIWSVLATWRYRQLITIKWRNYWGEVLPTADGIYVFLISRYMKKLDAKLCKELTQPTKLASYTFKIPGKPIVEQKDGVFLYGYNGNKYC